MFILSDSPRAITLHYHHGVMFWSDWGAHAKIEKADMNGQNRYDIVELHTYLRIVYNNGNVIGKLSLETILYGRTDWP